jgi:hypothetical protein
MGTGRMGLSATGHGTRFGVAAEEMEAQAMRHMSSTWKRERFGRAMSLVVLAGLGFLPAGLSSAAAAAPPQVKGEGSGIYLAPPFAGDRIDITLEAGGGSGHFDVIHHDKLGNTFGRLSGLVTCLSLRGKSAFTSGIITAGQGPKVVGELVGKALAITIVDDGAVHLAGVSFPLDRIPPCSPWPLNMLIDRGGYTISS